MPELRSNLKKTRGLALIFAEANHARIHAGLTLACGSAALGRRVRLFFQAEAVCALQAERRWGGDATFVAAGMPSISELIHSALELGVSIMACPTGLHMCGMAPATLDERIESAGMVAFLADAKGDDIVMP